MPCRLLYPKKWNGTVVIWAHPGGCASLTAADGKPVPAAKTLLDGDAAVFAIDIFMSGEFKPPTAAAVRPASTKPNPNPPYSGYVNGYNRAIIANRVHDLVNAVTLVHGWGGIKSVRLVAFTDAGPWAVLAAAVAGDGIDRTAIELNGFNFDKITSDTDPLLLPGALKYGGVYGFVPLFGKGNALLSGARDTGRIDLARRIDRVSVEEQSRDPVALATWVLK